MFNAYVKLNNPGLDSGPIFNLTANTGTITPATASKAELEATFYVTLSDNAATQVTITSVGTCTNAITLDITGKP